MSQIMAQNFLIQSQQDVGLQAMLGKARSIDEVISIGSIRGFNFTESEFNSASYEFDDSAIMDEVELEIKYDESGYCGRCCGRSCCSCGSPTAVA